MAKRFIDTDIFKKQFVRTLPYPYKLLWVYIFAECNHAGIWDVDLEVAEVKLNVKLEENQALNFFKNKVLPIKDGEKWFIPDFIEFQYGKLKFGNRAHQSVISLLKKENLLEQIIKNKPLASPLPAPVPGAKDKDMDMDMDKVKDKDMDKEMDKDKDMVKDKDMDKDKDKGRYQKTKNIILPFNTEAFSNAWKAWTDYKEAQFKFRYRSDATEQIALKELAEKAENKEATAIKIIQQSIANGWKGFFELKQKTTQSNGKYTPEDYQRLGNTIDEWFERKYGE